MARFVVFIVHLQLATVALFMVMQVYFLNMQEKGRPVESACIHAKRIFNGRKHIGNDLGGGHVSCKELIKSHASTSRRLYLTYQPPDGGWNNHRIALENALMMAKLLNRTLIVHPVASHDVAISLRKKHLRSWRSLEKQWGINWVYNHMDERDLVPMSQVLDLKRLAAIVDVHEVKTNHKQFLAEFSSLKWHTSCHSDALGFWVDAIPAQNKSSILGVDFALNNSSRSVRACPSETMKYKHAQKPLIREILSELQNIKADVIYLSQDTSYKANVQFFHREDAVKAQDWIFSYMRFSPQVYSKTFQILAILPQPFNAIHVRRTDHKVSASLAPSHWLGLMKNANFLNVSTALYIATDELDKNWFKPFHTAGYQLYFSDEFFRTAKRTFDMDIRGFHDQLICIHAKLFVGSKSSSFSGFIYRSRGQVMKKDGLVLSHMPIGWLGHKLKRNPGKMS